MPKKTMNKIDAFNLHLGVTNNVFDLPEEQREEIAELLELVGKDQDGVWEDMSAEEALSEVLKMQMQAIQRIKMICPPELLDREVELARRVWLTVWEIRRRVIHKAA